MSRTDAQLLAGLACFWMLAMGWLYAHHLRLLAVLVFFGGGVLAALLIRANNRDDSL
jgi:hypothetical protein